MSTRDRAEKAGSCSRGQEAPAYLLDELTPDEKRAFEAHVAACPECARSVESFGRVIERMRQLPPEARGRDLAPEILARLPAEAWTPARLSWWRREPIPALAGIAALLLAAAAVAGLLIVGSRPANTKPAVAATGGPLQPAVTVPPGTAVTPSPLAMVESAREWLLKTQAIEGGWAAGQPDHGIGVSALALLALMNDNPDVFLGPHAAAVRKGIGYLVENQDAQGLIGPHIETAPYNQGMAALAILSACAMESNAVWRAAGEKALAFVAAAQLPSGGWGYLQSTPSQANTSASIWPLQALIRGDELRVPGLRPHIDRGLAWLQSAVNRDGFMGYARADDFPYGQDTMTAAGIVCFIKDNKGSPHPAVRALLPALRRVAAKSQGQTDFYRLFFVAQAVGLADDEQARSALSAISGKLASLQHGSGAGARQLGRQRPVGTHRRARLFHGHGYTGA